MVGSLADNLKEITLDILYDYGHERVIDKLNTHAQPNKDEVVELTEKLVRVIFPGYYKNKVYKVFSPQNSLAKSIAPGTRVSVKNQELRFDEGRKVVQPIESTLDESWVYTI